MLQPIRATWTSSEWQQRLSSEEAFLACFMPLHPDPDVGVQVLALKLATVVLLEMTGQLLPAASLVCRGGML